LVKKRNDGGERVTFEEGFDEEIIEEERRVIRVIEDGKRIVKVVVVGEMNGNGEEFVESVSILMETSCENERMNLLKMIY
jgi:hypothetical protein